MRRIITALVLFGLVGTVHAGNFPPTAPQVPYVPGAVIITGGTIDDTIIGGTTPAAGTFDPVKTTDTNDSHALSIIWNEDDSANRTINIVVNAGNRTLDLSENLTVGGGSAFTLTAEDTAGSILLDEQTFEVEGQGTATQLTKLVNANNAAATLTIEGTGAVVGQDTTADAAVTFAGVTIGAADDFFLDGGTDTKIEEISADATAFWVGGVEGARIAESARTIESDATVCETDGGDLRIVTVADHDVYLNDVAQFADGTGGLCTGLAAATNYYVTQRDDAKKFNVATSRGGSNITFTDAGTAFTSYDMEIDTWVYGRLQLPSNDDPANPTLCFNGGGTCNSGYMESEENTLDTIINGTTELTTTASFFSVPITGAAALRLGSISLSKTSYGFFGDDDTGLLRLAEDQLSHIAGAQEIMRMTENTYNEIQIFEPDSTHGGYVRRVFAASSGTLTGATDTIELNIPTDWRIEQCQLHVKTAVVDTAGDDTWSSELNDGGTEEVISAGSAAAQNTNVNHWAVAETWGTLADAETDILLTPNGGNFSAGEIEAHCIAKSFDTWDNE